MIRFVCGFSRCLLFVETHAWLYRYRDTWIDIQMDNWIDKWVGRWVDREIGALMDKWIDDRQTMNREVDR